MSNFYDVIKDLKNSTNLAEPLSLYDLLSGAAEAGDTTIPHVADFFSKQLQPVFGDPASVNPPSTTDTFEINVSGSRSCG